MSKTIDYDQVLTDVSAYIPDGIVDFTNPLHVRVLREALMELGFGEQFITEYADNLKISATRLREAPEESDDNRLPAKRNGSGESGASKEATQKGLEHIAFKYYGKNGVVQYKSSDDSSRLIPLSDEEKDKAQGEADKDSGKTPTKEPSKDAQPGEEKPAAPAPQPDATHTPVFTQSITPNDQVYAKNSALLATQTPFTGIENIVKTPRYPKKYAAILERMMNTKFEGDAEKVEYYTEGGGAGAGTTKSKAGEIAAMMFTSMTDEEFDALYPAMLKHMDTVSKSGVETTLDVSWLKAARNARNSTLQRFHMQYPNGKISACAWDVPEEVEAMGMPYNSKEESTDVFYKIETPDGKVHYDQSSLKKDLAAALRNPGAGKMKEWDPNLSKEVDPDAFYADRAKDYIKAAKTFFPKSPYAKQLASGGGKKSMWKEIYSGIEKRAAKGDKKAELWIRGMNDKFTKWNGRVVNEFTRNKKLVKGVLENIVEELPIRGIISGKESITIGNVSFDKFTAKEIFQTDNYEEVKTRLVVVSPKDGGTPYLSYRAGKGIADIPIAKVRLKDESGRYSTSAKFILDFHTEFGKKLSEAHKMVYKQIIEQLMKRYGAI